MAYSALTIQTDFSKKYMIVHSGFQRLIYEEKKDIRTHKMKCEI